MSVKMHKRNINILHPAAAIHLRWMLLIT